MLVINFFVLLFRVYSIHYANLPFHSFCSPSCHRQDALQRHWDKYCRKKSKRHVHRHRFYNDEGSYASDDSDSGVVLLGPAPGSGGASGGGGVLSRAEKEEDEAALGGASGVDLKSYRVIVTSGRRRTVGVKDRKGKGKARAGGGERTKWVDGDGDVRMTDEDSDLEVDELESEDPLDGYRYEYDDDYDSVSEHERREELDCGDRDDEEEFDELDDSGDDEGMERRGRGDVKSDAEGVSVSGGDDYTSGSEDSEEEEENSMDVEGAHDDEFGRGREGFVVGEGRSNGAVVFDRSAARQPPLPHPSKAPKPESSLMTKLAVTSSTNGFAIASSVLNGKTYKPSTSRRRTPASSSSRSAVSGYSSTRTPSAPPPPPPQVVADADTVARHPPLPMSAFTSTFPAQPNMPRPRGAPGGRTRSSTAAATAATAAVMVVPVSASPSQSANGNGSENGQAMIALPSPVSGPSNVNSAFHPPRLRSHSRTTHGPGRGPSRARGSNASTRRGPKPRRNDYDAILDPSQTAAQGGQIRMRVLPQATYMPPVQPALAIMHEQPHVAKRKGKRTDGLVPDYGFVPREYVYRERE